MCEDTLIITAAVADPLRLRRRVVLNLGHFDFEIVSDFDIRISYFKLPDNSLCNKILSSISKIRRLLAESIVNRLSSVFCHLSSVNCLQFSVFCLPSSVFCVPLHLSRILYKSPTFYAKQTQFPKGSNERKLTNNNEL